MDSNTRLKAFAPRVTSLSAADGPLQGLQRRRCSTRTLLFGVNVASGAYILNAGTLNVPTLTGRGTFNFNGGTLSSVNSLTLTSTGRFNFKGGASQVQRIPTISIDTANGAKLDLGSAKLITTTSIGSWNGSNYDGVLGMIKSGRNGGTWDGGGMITSDTSAPSPNSLTTLAVATAQSVKKTSFGGVSVAPADVLVMLTYTGDATMNGKIDADDYFQIDSHYNKTANSAKSFINGDFNYDGQINGDDYFLIDNAYVGQGAPFSAGPLPGGVSAVPEPASGLVLVLAAMCMRRRRRLRCATCPA